MKKVIVSILGKTENSNQPVFHVALEGTNAWTTDTNLNVAIGALVQTAPTEFGIELVRK